MTQSPSSSRLEDPGSSQGSLPRPATRPTAAMYNGVGLQTPRGSDTSGHVQASKFLAKPQPSPSAAAGGPTGPSIDGGMRKPNKDILEHDWKRQMELRLLELRDALEEQGYTEGEIEERVAEARKAAEADAAEEGTSSLSGEGFMDTQSHHAAAGKEKHLEKLRGALGLDTDDMRKNGISKAM